MREGPYFRPILKTYWVVPWIIIMIMATPLLLIEMEGLHFLFQVGGLLFVWVFFIFAIRTILKILRTYLVFRTPLNVVEACRVADAYFGTMEPDVSKRRTDRAVVYETSHFKNDINIRVHGMRTRTRFLAAIPQNARTKDLMEWLEGLGDSLVTAEEDRH